MNWKVAALYYFTPLENLPALQAEIKEFCLQNDICGTLLLAPEGINGTIAGPPEKLDIVMQLLDERTSVLSGEVKYSEASEKPFLRLKVRLKKEIVTLRAPEADPNKQVGTYIEPEEWNELISRDDIIVLDTRNIYETKIGMFEGALDPNTDSFTEFKDFVQDNLDPASNKKIAMYCTGGIRCEKASSYMLAHGFEEVYHLKGGILKYLEAIPAENSKWNGSCFVFDKRVAIDHGLKESAHKLCYGCRQPLEPEDLKNKSYEPGVSCPYCISDLDPERAEGLRMRQKQFNMHKEKAGDH
jgi:UPF0176 protein